MPDEQSNLNLPAAAQRPSGRRRGRRGGRGRSPRAGVGKSSANAEETPIPPETGEISAASTEITDSAADTSGDFREPHIDDSEAAPEEISQVPADAPVETAQEIQRVPEPQREPPSERPQRETRRPEPARPRTWVKPADFRPAETSAISQAVAHATQIAESLKHTIDQLDEILELVELAERQKLADEREIDELRRALRRIQPPRFQSPSRAPRSDEPQRSYRDQGTRHEDSRSARPPRENIHRAEESAPVAEEPPTPVD